jgi:hypothetical protein
MRFEVLRPGTLKSTDFWDVTPCSLVKFFDVPEERIASKFKVEKEAEEVNNQVESN